MTANHSHGAGTAIADTSLVRIEDIEVARAVERARTRLLLDQPSLAAAVMRIPVVQVHSDRLPMGIGAARGAIVVSQALRLKHDAWIMYAYAHNMLHLLFEHIERCGGRDRVVWDLSIDIATASLLDPLLSPEALNYLDYDPRPSHSTGFRLLVQQLGNLSCEQIYDHLFQQPPASQSKATAGEPNRAVPPSAFEGDARATGHDYDYEPAIGADVACSALDRALIMREIAGALAEVGKTAGKSAGRWAEVAQRARTRAVPWERLFAERLGGLIPTDYQTFPFSKRHLWRGVYLPSVARKGVGRILFAIDTSGSMSLPVLGQITDQIDQLRQATGCALVVAHFDTQIQRTAFFDEHQDPIPRGALEMPGRGGTDLRAPFAYAAERMKHGENFAGIVVATDGCGPLPTEQPSVPTIWLVPDADLRSFRPPFGTVIACGGSAHGAT
jgi:hypothetical protein